MVTPAVTSHICTFTVSLRERPVFSALVSPIFFSAGETRAEKTELRTRLWYQHNTEFYCFDSCINTQRLPECLFSHRFLGTGLCSFTLVARLFLPDSDKILALIIIADSRNYVPRVSAITRVDCKQRAASLDYACAALWFQDHFWSCMSLDIRVTKLEVYSQNGAISIQELFFFARERRLWGRECW